ncbi:MAG: hypothetical protein ACUVSC_12735, partial [Candidatus Fervidibacter sp.]|uniref:hypothetical protein n=1 Tax=Candidatus Fervidibacter sp. TaxID=3100871 RepID=UPI00404A8CD2
MKAKKRKFLLGCLTIFPLMLLWLYLWGLFSARQVPTLSLTSSNAFIVIHGPTDPNDEGFKSAWESLVEGSFPKLAFILKFLKPPKELTAVVLELDRRASIAINFSRGSPLLWLLFRFFGAPYRSVRYIGGSEFLLGMFGGTLLMSGSEIDLKSAVDTVAQNLSSHRPSPLKLSKLHNRYDFICIVNPKVSHLSAVQIPANLMEIGVDIVSADEVRGDGLVIFQSEREAEIGVREMVKG